MAQANEDIILGVKVKYDGAIDAIANMRKQIDDLRASNKKLAETNKDIDKNSEAYKANAKEIEKNKIAIKELSYEESTLSKQVQNQVREELATRKQQEGSLKQLRAQLSQLTKQYDELSAAERKADNEKTLEQGGLKARIKDIATQLKQTEGETERFYRNVGNYEDAIRSVLGVNNNFANSIMGMASSGEGIKGFFATATTSVQSFGKALMSLAANPIFLAIAGITGAVTAFKWFYDYNQGIAEATRLTKEFFGIEGEALRGVRDSIQATADVMGKDYVEVLKTVDSLMTQFDISSEEALKAVNEGFAAGADQSGDMLAKLQQYAPTFHDAGLKASEMVAIIAQTRSGIFSDKGLTVISKASSKIREMSTATASALDTVNISSKKVEADLVSGARTTFDVIQEVSEKLKELPQNGQEVGTVMKEIFGESAAEGGLKMIESLDTISTKMEDVLAVTGEYGQLQLEQIEAQNELNDAVSTLFDMSDQGWENMITRVKIFATKTLTALIRKIIEIVNYFIDLYNESTMFRAAVQAIIVLFKGMWETAKMVFGNMLAAIKGVAKALSGVGDIFIGIITLDPSHVKSGLATLRDAFITGIKEIGENSTQYGKAMVDNFLDGAQKAARDHINPLSSALGVDSGTGGGDASPAGGQGSGRTGASSSNSKKSASDRAKSLEERAKTEREIMAKTAEMMNRLIENQFERQRETINLNYDKQIADVKEKMSKLASTEVKARRSLETQLKVIEQLRAMDLAKIDEAEMKQAIELENRRIALKLQAIKQGSKEELDLKLQQIDNEHELEAKNLETSVYDEQKRLEMLLDLEEGYQKKREELIQQYRDKEREDMLLAMQNDYQEKLNATTNDLERLRIELEQAQAIRDAAHQKQGESEEQWRQRQLQLERDYTDKKKALRDKEVEIEQNKFQAIAQMSSALSGLLNEFADDNREIAIASKMLAIAEVAVQQGLAIANAVRAASEGSHSAWELALQIGVSIAAVTTSIVSAMKSIRAAKFSTGGRVLGAGSGTSDSIPAMLSNGESVINANSTAMFSPLLSAINQLGGGIPIHYNGQSQMGEDFLAAAVAKGMAYAPTPIVTVEDINRGQRRVQVVENLGNV